MSRPPSFDLLAPIYHFLERITYGPMLHDCRTAHLDRLLLCKKALILGDGDGRFLLDLLKANRHIQVDSVDISPGMLRLAQRRIAKSRLGLDRVRFLLADAQSLSWPTATYDLVITNFFLDCFPTKELQAIIERVAAATVPGALWLDGDFRIPTGKLLRIPAQVTLAGMYLFFAMTTRLRTSRLTDPADLLVANGFSRVSEIGRLGGFLTSRLWKRNEASMSD